MFRWTQSITVICVSLVVLPVAGEDEVSTAAALQQEATADPAKVEFFEARIRPALVEHCYSCHSADARDVKGGLLLDSRPGILAGGDSGAAVVPGNPDASLLLEVLRHEGLEMPPDRKLPDGVIADFAAWIRDGAADPRLGKVAGNKRTIDIEQGREFWCFRPIQRPLIPATEVTWATTDIDRLIVAEQLAMANRGQKLVRAAEASPEILIRRLTFVLTGLPPTLEEQEDFADSWADNPYTAMESTVDRLLESPHFGERWGRHWLDVARFSESTGGGRSLMLPDAWRFRDYVIRSFNTEKPFDQLVREHIAGDLLPFSSDGEHDAQIIGAGYLMLGAINYEEQDKEQLRMDVVDEQIDSMGRSFLGMTLGCCRCHDHKFDPIPTSDYYALAGIFRSTKSLLPNNVSDFVTAPLRVGHDKVAVEAWAAQDKELERQITALQKSMPKGKRNAVVVVSKSPQLEELAGVVVDDQEATFDGTWIVSSFQQPFVGVGYRHCGQPRTGLAVHYEAKLPVDGEYRIRMVINSGESRSNSIPVLVVHADGESIVTVSQQTAPSGDGVFAELGRFRFEADTPAKVTVKASEASAGYVIADAIQFVESSMAVVAASPGNRTAADNQTTEAPPIGDAVARLTEELKTLEAKRAEHKKHQPSVPTAMCVRDEETPADWHVHIRGEIRNLGAVVPRGFLAVATPATMSSTVSATAAKSSSGRRELAEWLASPNNPLTARVYVNRVWMHVMGEGIVRTPDNFGETGERPTHQELLDYLADSFMTEDDWSTKKLVRRLCLTSAFRMASQVSSESRTVDPENQSLTRGFRRRLDAESIRDSLLRISGNLDLSIQSGRTIVKLSTYDNEYHHEEHPMSCRSVYVPSFRNTMFDLFEVFDVANPNVVTGKRTNSLRPAQSLYMLNSPFVMGQAQQAATTFLASSSFRPGDAPQSVRNAWRICLGRGPSGAELAAALQTVGEQPDSERAWSTVFHSLFASVDFRYVD
ncbi:MAG: DUF1553 domain-containing protein [Planctomycetaceae bacterium]